MKGGLFHLRNSAGSGWGRVYRGDIFQGREMVFASWKYL